MDFVRLASPWVLAGLLPVWALIGYAFLAPGRHRERRPSRAALACLTAALLLLALAGPSVRVSREGACPVVLAEDISPSMPAAAGNRSPTEALAPWTAALPLGQVVLHPFADSAATDVGRGIDEAARALPGTPGIVLLYTDARETRGDAVAAAARLAAAGVQVHAIVPDLRPRDVAVVLLEPAGEAIAGRPVPVLVQLASTVPAEAQVVVARPAVGKTPEQTWKRRVTVDPLAGAVLLFQDAALPAGLYHYDAQVRAPGDVCPENDRAACAARVGRPQEILYVRGSDGPAALADVLAANAPAGASLRTVPAASGIDLAGVSVVVLDNVSAWTLGRGAARRLARRVTDGGLGLLVLGGDAAFAAGGYADSPLEDLLPVSSRTGERPPLDMVLVVDASGSMNETYETTRKLALAKQAVLALRPALGDADRMGIVAFAGEPRVVSPLTPVARWDDLRAQVIGIQAGGGTRITPAVEAAAGLFAPPKEGDKTVRHIMLLSDGRSEDFDVDHLVALCRRGNITVSTVATGTDAYQVHIERLDALAYQSGGKCIVGGLGYLAETFLYNLAHARGEGIREVMRDVQWVRPEPIWRAPGPDPVLVPSYNVTRPKEGADVHWVTAPLGTETDASPLLASWRRGLGKVAAMPWPVGRIQWSNSPRDQAQFAPLLAWLSAQPLPTDWSARLVRRGGACRVRVEERSEAVGKSSAPFVATPLADSGEDAPPVVLEQTAPGIHEGEVAGGTAVVVHRPDDSGAAVTLSAPGRPPPEFERLGVDRAKLEAIVNAGGGRIHASPASLVEAVEHIRARGYKPVGIHLLWAAAAMVVLQVVLRLLGRL